MARTSTGRSELVIRLVSVLCRVNSGSWVKWVCFLDGSYGSWVDALSTFTHDPPAYLPEASSAECERQFSASNARHIITSQRNVLFPKTVEALSIVLEGYKNKLLQ